VQSQPVPEAFGGLVDLAADVLGGFVLFATDDYFAGKENLLRPEAPVWKEGAYTDKGKWMDGWESQRKREPGHDWAIVRLGAPGVVRGVLVDTTHFKGNAPQAITLEGLEAPHTATAAELGASDAWSPLVAQRAVKPDFQNVIALASPSRRVTHVRLHIHPDGGVARLRVFGEVAPDARVFWSAGSVDLGAVENGGAIAAQSDAFFGPPQNMLLPGRGVNMGDGWETKRRRTPGSDWAVVRLARRGVLERIDLDTHFFKGNAPQAVRIDGLDAASPSAAALAGTKGWRTLVERTQLVQHHSHLLTPDRPTPVTHVRVHIFPHGGVNRLRLHGHALDTGPEQRAIAKLNALGAGKALALFQSCCGSRTWAQWMVDLRPFGSVRELFAEASEVWWSAAPSDWEEAFAAHPRIGQRSKAAPQSARSATWSQGEQRGVDGASADTQARLAALNEAYFKKHGFTFIVCATGKSADEMLALLEDRRKRSRAQELDAAAVEQHKITALRLEKWLRAEMER